MRHLRRIFVAFLTVAVIVGAMPGGLALGCITHVPQAALPCNHDGSDDPDAADLGCICIHYPAPHAPGSFAVIAAPTIVFAHAVTAVAVPPMPDALPSRGDPPDPPPPR